MAAYKARSKRSNNNTVGNKPFRNGRMPSAAQRLKGAGDKITEDDPDRIYRPRAGRGIGRSGRRPT